MQLKDKIKIGSVSIFVLILLISGIVMFIGFIRNKQVYETDLYAHLPSSISSILQVNKEKNVDKILPYINKLAPVLTAIKAEIGYPIVLPQYEKESYLILKVTSSQEKKLKEILSNNAFPTYPPKLKEYNGAELFFYTDTKSNFFICTFFDGVFIGGFNIKLFEEYIDNKQNENLGILDIPQGKETLNKMIIKYDANLFLNNHDSFSIFNVNFDIDNIEMNGVSTEVELIDWEESGNKEADTLIINYEIFPNSLIAYEVEMNNHLVTDTLRYLFAPQTYSFHLKKDMSAVHALKHMGDKFEVYNLLNDMQLLYTGKRFNINDFHSGYRIYTTSKQLSKTAFDTEKPVYITFYKDYMFYSKNKNSLAQYLKSNGKFNSKGQFQTDQTEEPLNSFIYTRNIKEWSPLFFNPDNPITNKNNKDVYITSTIKNKYKTYNININ